MKQKAAEPGIDDRLTRLLEVERRLEERVRTAEAEARAGIEAARAAAERADGSHREEVLAAALVEEQADLARHAAELERISREGAARVAALQAVPDAEVLRLATKALGIVAGFDADGAVRS